MENNNSDPLATVKTILAENAPEPEPAETDHQDSGPEPAEPDVSGDEPRASEDDSAGDDAPDDVEAPAEEDSDGDSGVSLKDLASQLGLEPADLYDVDISMGQGEAVTIGELKDAFKEYGPIKEAQQKLSNERDDHEKQVLQTRSELNGILAVIPPEMRDAVLKAGRQYNAQYEAQQRDETLAAIPEWREPDTLAKDRAAIVSAGAEYGFSEPEMQHTTDARTLRMLRDFTRMKARIKELEEAPSKAVRNKPGAAGKQNTRKLTKRRLNDALAAAKRSTDMADKKQAIKYLVGQQ